MTTIKSEDFKSSINEPFTSKEMDILERNKKFFSTDRKYVDIMLKIINGESDISIRVLDWFVANYSKKNNTSYMIRNNNRQELFYVNNEYKNQLNGYSKQYFDPFCRKKKVIYSYRSNNNDSTRQGKIDMVFVSSIGQLNFFHWAIRNKVIKYVDLHLKEIEKDMKDTSKRNKEQKNAALEKADISMDDKNIYISDEPDPVICSSDKINSLNISSSPLKKVSSIKTDSETRNKRQQLCRSVYDHGIKKSNIPIKLDFD